MAHGRAVLASPTTGLLSSAPSAPGRQGCNDRTIRSRRRANHPRHHLPGNHPRCGRDMRVNTQEGATAIPPVPPANESATKKSSPRPSKSSQPPKNPDRHGRERGDHQPARGSGSREPNDGENKKSPTPARPTCISIEQPASLAKATIDRADPRAATYSVFKKISKLEKWLFRSWIKSRIGRSRSIQLPQNPKSLEAVHPLFPKSSNSRKPTPDSSEKNQMPKGHDKPAVQRFRVELQAGL